MRVNLIHSKLVFFKKNYCSHELHWFFRKKYYSLMNSEQCRVKEEKQLRAALNFNAF